MGSINIIRKGVGERDVHFLPERERKGDLTIFCALDSSVQS